MGLWIELCLKGWLVLVWDEDRRSDFIFKKNNEGLCNNNT